MLQRCADACICLSNLSNKFHRLDQLRLRNMDYRLPSEHPTDSRDSAHAGGSTEPTPASTAAGEPVPIYRLRCELVTDFSALEALSDQWALLHARSREPEIFQDFRWAQAWWRTVGKGARLFTPVVYRGPQIVGLLPLVLEAGRLRFLGHSVSDYNHLIAQSEDSGSVLESCLDCLRDRAGQWTELLLDNVPELSDLTKSMRQLPARLQRAVIETKGDRCPALVLHADRAVVVRAGMSKKFRQAVKRLSRHGQLRFRHLDNPLEATAKLADLATQHIRRSVLAGRRSRFLDQDYASFFTTLLALFDPRTEIRFSVLELGQRAIACHFGTLYDGKYLYYKPSFDVDLWDLAPGQVLLWHLLDHLPSVDAREFDFGRGDEPYKQRFANQVRQNLNFVVYPPGNRSLLYRRYRRLRGSVKEWLQASPRAERWLRAAIAASHDLLFTWRQDGAMGATKQIVLRTFAGMEEWRLLSIDPTGPAALCRPELHFEEISLGRIADLAADSPEIFTSERLTLARQWCHEERTAWVANLNAIPCAVVWTSLHGELTLPTGSLVLPDRSILVSDIWPLDRQRAALVDVLHAFGRTVRERGLAAFALCPKRNLPPELLLQRHGINTQQRWEQSRR